MVVSVQSRALGRDRSLLSSLPLEFGAIIEALPNELGVHSNLDTVQGLLRVGQSPEYSRATQLMYAPYDLTTCILL